MIDSDGRFRLIVKRERRRVRACQIVGGCRRKEGRRRKGAEEVLIAEKREVAIGMFELRDSDDTEKK